MVELKYTNWWADLPPKGGKFAAKMTFNDRMAFLCIYHSENNRNNHTISVTDIAKAAGISVPVATSLLSFTNEKYKQVKNEYRRLGPAKAYQTYVEEKHIAKIRAVRDGAKPPELPGQILLGGRNFIIAQIENGKWVGTDMKTSFTTEWHDTREGATDEAIQLATILAQQNS